MKVLASSLLVIALTLALAVALGCFGGKRTRGGTNIGSGSDHDGPWSKGGNSGGDRPALVPDP